MNALPHNQGFQAGVEEVLARIPASGGQRFVVALERGELKIELYAPRGNDPQQPHTQDEIYVVVRGSGDFRCADRVAPFASGDILFVPAGVVHRFERFSDDLVVWVIFYGPEHPRAA